MGTGISLFLFSFVAFGQTTADLQAQIQQLLNQVATLQAQLVQKPAAPPCTFSRTLTVAITGEDVRCLQKYLNANGFIITENGVGSVGQESTYFGLKTKAAVIAWQSVQKIAPTSGIFGPISRARYAELAIAPVLPPPPPPTDPAPVPPPAVVPPPTEPPSVTQPTCYERLVPSAYPTIQAAVDVACPDDHIVVAPGNYAESITVGTTGLTLTAASGPMLTTIAPPTGPGIMLDGGVGAVTIDGFMIVGTSEHPGIYVPVSGSASVVIKHSIIKNTSVGISVVATSGTVLIERNLIVNNRFEGIHDGVSGTGLIRAEHNTLIGNDIGYFLDTTGGTHRVINSIVTSNLRYGIALSSASTDQEYKILSVNYTDTWGNKTENYYSHRTGSTFTPVGIGNLISNPILLETYIPAATSPVVDTGDPTFPNDTDGTRADIGVYMVEQ